MENPNGMAGHKETVSLLCLNSCKGTNEVADESKHLVTQDLSLERPGRFGKQ